MKRGTRDVVRAILDELGAVPFTEDEPLYRIGRRLLFAELVLAEVRDDDLEGGPTTFRGRRPESSTATRSNCPDGAYLSGSRFVGVSR